MDRLIGILGIFSILGIAYLFSNNRKKNRFQINFMGHISSNIFCFINFEGSRWKINF